MKIGVVALEERIGDRHHLAHQRDAIDEGQHDDKGRRGERQIARDRVFVEALRPEAEQMGDVGRAEQRRLDGKQIRHHFQERRERVPRQRDGGADRGGDAVGDRHRVGMRKADGECDDGEGGEDQGAQGQWFKP